MPTIGISRFFLKILSCHSTKKLRRGTLLPFTIFLVSINFVDKRGGEEEGGSITVFCRKFFVSKAKKLLRRSLLYFGTFLLAKIFMHKRGKVAYHDFPSKLSCLTVPKLFVGESFSASLVSEIEKIYAYDWNIDVFFRNFVVS